MNALQKVVARLFNIKGDMATAGMSRTMSVANPDLARWLGTPTYSGKSVTDESAMQVSVAWACVRILAETIGSLPLAMYRRDPKTGNAVKVDHELSSVLINSPNENMTSVEYREAITVSLALRGNTYSLIERGGGGSIISLTPLPATSVTPKRNENGVIVFEVTDRGKKEVLPREKVWHVKGFGDGIVGLSPIAYARQTLGIAMAAEEFQARFFANGAAPSWLISIPQWLEPDQREIARENINRLWSGLDNVHRAQLLEGGMTATSATMPLEDAQFMELRGFSIQEICRIYRIPPHMVMDLSRSTNNNIEHQGQEFVMFTLAPYLTRLEASVSRWLLSPEDRTEYFLRFNVDALLRADAAGRAALYSSGLQNGWLTRNEVRALENRNTSDEEGMGSFTTQSNLVPVERLFEEPAEAAPARPERDVETDDKEKRVEPTLKELLSSLASGRGPQTVNVQLSSDMKRELASAIEIPDVKALTEQLRKNTEAAEQTDMRKLIDQVRKANERTLAITAKVEEAHAAQQESLKALIEYSKADRVLVEDENGVPIRSRVVIN